MCVVQQRPLLKILFFDPLFKVLYLPSLLSLRLRWVNARQVTQTCRLILCQHCHLCGHSSCLRNFFCSFSFLRLVSRKFIYPIPQKFKLLLLVLIAHSFEHIHKALTTKLRVKISTEMAHTPSALQINPWCWLVHGRFLQFLNCLQHTSMSVMKDAHIWAMLHNCPLQMPEEP